MGEPYKMTTEAKDKFKEAFAIGADVTAAAYYVGVDRQTYYDHCKKDPDFKDECERLRQKPVLKAYQTVAKNLDNIDTAKWYLSKKRKNEFGEKVEFDAGGELKKALVQYLDGKDSNNTNPDRV